MSVSSTFWQHFCPIFVLLCYVFFPPRRCFVVSTFENNAIRFRFQDRRGFEVSFGHIFVAFFFFWTQIGFLAICKVRFSWTWPSEANQSSKSTHPKIIRDSLESIRKYFWKKQSNSLTLWWAASNINSARILLFSGLL